MAILAVGAAVGVLLPCAARAQEVPDAAPADSRALLATMKPQRVEQGGGVFYSNLAGLSVYFISDGTPSHPAYLVIAPPQRRKVAPGELRTLAERFRAVYKLRGYAVVPAEDGSAVLLLRDHGRSARPNLKQLPMLALAHDKSLAPAISWLNATLEDKPQRLDGSRLVWRRQVASGGIVREMEVSLDLLRGAPCIAEVKLPNVGVSRVTEVLAEKLRLEFEIVPAEKASSLRRLLGGKPLRLMEGKARVGRKLRQVEACLMRVPGEGGIFRLGEVATLQQFHEQQGRAVAAPELPPVAWVDDPEGSRVPEWAKPAPAPVAEAKPSPVAADAAPGEAKAVVTPEEARRAYAERLQAL